MATINAQNTTVRIEINSQLLAKILTHRTVTAADIRCLDSASKKQLWRLCLRACAEDS